MDNSNLVPAEIVKRVQFVFSEATVLFEGKADWGIRPGAFLCVADSDTGLPLFAPTAIGQPSEDKAEKCEAFYQEKAKRLAEHPNHISSWESRNPDENRYAGAIRISTLIFSLSGLPELADEAVVLVAAAGYFNHVPNAWKRLLAIAEQSKNPYFSALVGSMSRHTL